MRTTVDFPDQLLRQAKAAAAHDGRTLREFLIEAVEQRLAGKNLASRKRVTLPLVRSKAPGSVCLTGEDIGKLLDQDHAAVSS